MYHVNLLEIHKVPSEVIYFNFTEPDISQPNHCTLFLVTSTDITQGKGTYFENCSS